MGNNRLNFSHFRRSIRDLCDNRYHSANYRQDNDRKFSEHCYSVMRQYTR